MSLLSSNEAFLHDLVKCNGDLMWEYGKHFIFECYRSVIDKERWQAIYPVRERLLKTELSLGLTFASIANQATDGAKIQRNLNAAQRAYDTVCRFRWRVAFSPNE